MRASFLTTIGLVLAVISLTSNRAGAEYPFDAVPPLPPLAGTGSAHLPSSYDGASTVPMSGPEFDDGRQGFVADDFAYDDSYGPADAGLYAEPPLFDRLFAGPPPLWIGYVSSTFMPGTDRVLWNGELFLPLWQDGNNLWFFDMRGQIDNADAGEFNIGTGFRTLAPEGWIFGSYIFYDRLFSANDNRFSQGTIGFEVMDYHRDFRLNVYFPESRGQATSAPPSATISDGTIVVRSGVERAYWGLDLEAGHLLWATGPNAQHEVRGFVGVYHFDNSSSGFDNITGPRARLEWRWYDLPHFGIGSRFTCGLTVQADGERGGDAFLFAGLRIPLDPWAHARRPLSPLQRRMVDPLVRDVDVVSNVRQMTEAAVNPQTGQTINSARVIDNRDDLAALLPESSTNSIVVIDGNAGDIISSSAIKLRPGQTVFGGGSQMTVRGARTGRAAVWTAPGSRPTIEFNPNSCPEGFACTMVARPPTAGFVMADDTRLVGMDLRGGQGTVLIENADRVSVSDLNIRDAQGVGIALQDARHVSLDNIVIDGVGQTGAVPSVSNVSDGSATIFPAAAAHQGIGITGVNSSDINIRNVHIQKTFQSGITLVGSQDTVIEHVTMNRTGDYGILTDDAVNTRISSVGIEGSNNGLRFSGGSGLSVSDTQIVLPDMPQDVVFLVPPRFNGISLDEVTGTADIRDSEVRGGTTGLRHTNTQDGALDLTVANNLFEGDLRLSARGASQLTARISDNTIGTYGAGAWGTGSSVGIDGGGTGTSDIGFFNNNLQSKFSALASQQRDLNLVIDGNQLGAVEHVISNEGDATVQLRYRDNSSLGDVLFQEQGDAFSIEPLIGNDHTPMFIGNVSGISLGTLETHSPGLFD